MTDSIKSWVEERRACINATTDGPWEWVPEIVTEAKHRPARVEGLSVSLDLSDIQAVTIPDRTGDARFIVDAHNNLPRALNALNAVLERHQPVHGPWTPEEEFCDECSCAPWSVWVSWPCPTVQAIEGAINE